jgi:UDP-3-O-[3-hydroxymyristoyl] N-acetylglucosamine deacetylase
MKQKTVEKVVTCAGLGLHSGKKVHLSFHPAVPGTGIVFAVKGKQGTRFIRNSPELVVGTNLCTTLGYGGVTISTVEHVLAAIHGLGLDNLIIEVEGNELPILDGSAAPFVFLLRQAGIRHQQSRKRMMTLKKEFCYQENGAWIKATPADAFQVDYRIDFPHPLIGRQRFRYTGSDDAFVRELSRARTFGFLHQVEDLQKNGLALGGSLENAVVLDEYGVVNQEGLRFDDEPVRHKLLDFIGDLSQLPYTLCASFQVSCSGHSLNNTFVRRLSERAHEFLQPVRTGERLQPEYAPGSEKRPAAVGLAV